MKGFRRARVVALVASCVVLQASPAHATDKPYSSPQRDAARCMGAYVVAKAAIDRMHAGETLHQQIERSDEGSELQPGDKEWRRGVLMTTFATMSSASMFGLTSDQIAEAVRGECQYALGVPQ